MTVSSEDVGEDIEVYKRNGVRDARKDCRVAKRVPYMI